MGEKNLHILLVEDDDIDREALTRHVRRENLAYELTTASSEEEARDALGENEFDVVLLDYDLGGASTGLDVLPYAGDSPVVFVTGGGDEEIAVEAMRRGAYDYMIKDQARNYLKILPSTIQNVLKRRNAEKERRAAEAALAASREELDSIVNSVPDIIYRLDDDSRVSFISESIRKYGYDPDELIGMDIFEIVHEADRANAIYRVNERRTGTRSTRSFEIRLLTKDNRPIPFEIFNISAQGLYGTRKPVESSFLGTQGIARDITERKKAEKEREKLIRDLQEAMAEVKTLSGLLPICASCKKVRDDKGYWNQIEEYLETQVDVSFSHGICPECLKELYGNEEWYKENYKE
ncbi:MAG: PAS domain S-box protein [Desulfobacterales bacterium]|nr:PAS domain S-box protein [Desulfobacterales bacterium]